MPYFLGVDTGATKTHAMLASETGEILALSEGGSGNHEIVGYDGLAKVLNSTLAAALASAGIRKDQIAGAGFGIAGYDWPSERQDTLDAIATLGLTCPLDAVNDSVVGLVAGSSQGWGVVVVAGTGNNVRAVDRAGNEVQVTGCGSAFGEYGGAIDVVARAVQVICYEWYGRGPRTALTPAFIDRASASSLFDLIEGLSQEKYTLSAEAAPMVFQVAEAGDPVAREVIHWVANEHAQTVCGVIRKIGFEQIPFEIVLTGSTFNGGSLYLDPLKKTIWNTAPQAQFLRLTAPPVVGGVLIGMRLAGLDSSAAHPKLLEAAGLAVGGC